MFFLQKEVKMFVIHIYQNGAAYTGRDVQLLDAYSNSQVLWPMAKGGNGWYISSYNKERAKIIIGGVDYGTQRTQSTLFI